MEPPTGAFLLVLEGEAAVACGGLRTLEPGLGEIKRMYVVPAARRRSHARRLLAVPYETLHALADAIAIIQSIVQLAKSFRMTVTAEGVETAEDFERMRELGCDVIQGYLFGRPLSYERANDMVLGLGTKRMAG